jgi:hypothetical protein
VDLYTWDLLLGSVIAGLVPVGLGEDAKKGRVSICGPVAKSEAANENGRPSKDRVEEIEGSHSRDTNEVKQRAFYTQISERLVQTLEDSICSTSCCFMVCHKASPLVVTEFYYETGRAVAQTPQSQVKTFTASTAIPVPAATPASAFFAPGSPWANP